MWRSSSVDEKATEVLKASLESMVQRCDAKDAELKALQSRFDAVEDSEILLRSVLREAEARAKKAEHMMLTKLSDVQGRLDDSHKVSLERLGARHDVEKQLEDTQKELEATSLQAEKGRISLDHALQEIATLKKALAASECTVAEQLGPIKAELAAATAARDSAEAARDFAQAELREQCEPLQLKVAQVGFQRASCTPARSERSRLCVARPCAPSPAPCYPATQLRVPAS